MPNDNLSVNFSNILDIKKNPLDYVFEDLQLKHKPGTLWLEFGVYTGNTINYISKFTNEKVYGFDSFEGLPEKWRDGFDKGTFNTNGELPVVNENVVLIKGWFNETLLNFIQKQNKKISFIHIDSDLYSSTKYVLTTLKKYIDNDCIIVFDELVNYPGFDGENGELKAWSEFITENYVNYNWIGMNGNLNDTGGEHEKVAVVINSIKPRVCFITAIYGNYESFCHKFVEQSILTDFICFTDNPNMPSNGWKIDTTPYHIINKSNLDTDLFTNSLKNNKHTFNIAKYYKQAFQNIPVLQDYDIIVWLDGTIEIIYPKTSEYLLKNIDKNIIAWNHDYHSSLDQETNDSNYFRYTSTFWNNQEQPYQDIFKQYQDYVDSGYIDSLSERNVWITCFVAFNNKDKHVKLFLDFWYLQTLKYTTQDQIGFPYTCQKTNLKPFTLPNAEISGNLTGSKTMFYIKHEHTFNLNVFEYGTVHSKINITEKVIKKCLKENGIFIPSGDFNRSDLFGDPVEKFLKSIFINGIEYKHYSKIFIDKSINTIYQIDEIPEHLKLLDK